MNLEVKDLLPKLKLALGFVRQYIAFIFVIVILLIYGFLIFKIGMIATVEPDEDAVTQQLNTTKRLRIDQQAVDKILQLEDRNIGVKSLFKSARDNPFQER